MSWLRWDARSQSSANLEGAIDSYREIVEWSSGSDYEVSVIEQLANCEFRLAHKRFRTAGAVTPEVTALLRTGRRETRRRC